jgi:hypothetical protein
MEPSISSREYRLGAIRTTGPRGGSGANSKTGRKQRLTISFVQTDFDLLKVFYSIVGLLLDIADSFVALEFLLVRKGLRPLEQV